ncbi:MAG: chemotaxis protein CheW [Gammaproteobacteria bacterium]|nr:chemotaxis protein CheW [Gammaproteobacteria bacterium]
MEVSEEVDVDVSADVIDKIDVMPEVAVSSQVEVQAVVDSVDQIPEWGMAPFKALFFNVGDTTLAVPLEKLSGILTECDDIKVMPGNAKRYLGVLVHRGKTIRVIDFEALVTELSGEPRVLSSGEVLPPNRIILIEGERIGIACRDVTDVEEIKTNDVRWRVGSTKRPWYRGIVVEKMCALLDVDALLLLLNDDAEGTL